MIIIRMHVNAWWWWVYITSLWCDPPRCTYRKPVGDMINGSWSAGHSIYIYTYIIKMIISFYISMSKTHSFWMLCGLCISYFPDICSPAPSKMPNTPMPRCTGKPHGAASVLSQMRGEIQHNPWKRGSVACHRGTKSSPCGDPKVTQTTTFLRRIDQHQPLKTRKTTGAY